MVSHYSEEDIKSIFSSEDFLQEVETLQDTPKTRDLIQFLNQIDTNSQYFRLGITKKKKRVPGTQCNDTQIIKEINQSLLSEIYYHGEGS